MYMVMSSLRDARVHILHYDVSSSIHSHSYHYNVTMGRLQSYHCVVTKSSTCSRTTQYCHQDQYVFMYNCLLSPGAIRVHVYFSVVTRSSTCSWISPCCHQEQYVFMNISMLSPGAVRVHEYLYVVTRSSTSLWISLCGHREQYVFMNISMLSPGAVCVHEYHYAVTNITMLSLCCAVTRSSRYWFLSLYCHQEQYVFIHDVVAELVRRKTEVDRYDEPVYSSQVAYSNLAYGEQNKSRFRWFASK